MSDDDDNSDTVDEGPFTFATTDELLAELGRRSKCFVAVAIFKTDEGRDTETLTYRVEAGEHFHALGIVGQAHFLMLRKYRDHEGK